jgi:glutamyl-tRNA reductase
MKALSLLASYEEKEGDLRMVAGLDIYNLNKLIKNKKSLSSKELDSAYTIIRTNLNEFRDLKEQVKPDIQEYHAFLVELQELGMRNNNNIKNTRRSMILWARAHASMSSGKWNPSEWIGFKDASTLLMKSARGAAGI